ncbi:MAG: replication protein [Chloroflexi bacterium]|nr:replication protein [Chloroflexota bacterium]
MTDTAAIIEALDDANLPDQQRRVANYVLRHTVAEGREGVIVQPVAVAHACRMSKPDARHALRRLVAKGIVRETSNRAYGLPPTLSINADPTTWRIPAFQTPNKE